METPTADFVEKVRPLSLNNESLGNLMVHKNILFEQRKYPRFKPKTQMFILHSQFGVINDISVNGLSYDYYSSSKEEPCIGSSTATIFVPDGDSLKNIPFVVIGDMIKGISDSYTMPVKKCRLCFPELIGEQLQDLESFIINYSTLPINHIPAY